MKLEQAMQRVIWRFQNCDIIKVNQKDIDAINTLIERHNSTQEKTINDDIYFAKLYSFVLGYFIKKFDTGIENPIPTRELHRLLERPLENIIHDITTDLNFRIKYKVLKNAGCHSDKHPLTIPEHERAKNLDKLKEHISIHGNKKFLINDTWEAKEIENGIKSQIANFLYEVR